MNAAIREIVNPFQSTEDEIRVGDRIMQTKNTDKVSNSDLGFIRYVEDTPEGKRIGLDFGEDRSQEYSTEDLVNLDLAYATIIHKAMGSEYDVVLIRGMQILLDVPFKDKDDPPEKAGTKYIWLSSSSKNYFPLDSDKM